MIDTWFGFLLFSLAVFRLTRLIVYDRITESFRRPFLQETAEISENGIKEIYLVPRESGFRGWIGELISCYWCAGIWCAAGLYLCGWFLPAAASVIVAILAAAGAAALLETIVQRIISE